MTIRVKVPSNTPASDTIWVFPSLHFSSQYAAHLQMNKVAGTTDTWQATITGPAGTMLPYYFARNNAAASKEAYAFIASANTFIFRKVLLTDGETIDETVADLPTSRL